LCDYISILSWSDKGPHMGDSILFLPFFFLIYTICRTLCLWI
jgi:hypothetical protein